MVLALPRGGVPVAAPVAAALGAPLDVFVARKVGAPGQPELGIGAVAEGLDTPVWSEVARALRLTEHDRELMAGQEMAEVQRRVHQYRGSRSLPEMAARDVVLVDDGLATGVTAEAALHALRSRNPRRLLLAVPVCAPETSARLRMVADEVMCVHSPAHFGAVGAFYERFDQTSDQEVIRVLDQARATAVRSTNQD